TRPAEPRERSSRRARYWRKCWFAQDVRRRRCSSTKPHSKWLQIASTRFMERGKQQAMLATRRLPSNISASLPRSPWARNVLNFSRPVRLSRPPRGNRQDATRVHNWIPQRLAFSFALLQETGRARDGAGQRPTALSSSG